MKFYGNIHSKISTAQDLKNIGHLKTIGERTMAKALRLEETCPKCGSHLMIREGEYGDFLACPRFPACKFTKPLPDGDLKIYQKPSPYCKECNYTGLLPFKNKKNKIVSHTYLFCECNPQSDGHSQPYPYQYTPEMFDFPMSYDFYRSLCQYHGWLDLGSITLE